MDKELVQRELEQDEAISKLLAPIFRNIIEKLSELPEDRSVRNFLENEKWFPMIKVTNIELKTSEILNSCIDKIIKKLS